MEDKRTEKKPTLINLYVKNQEHKQRKVRRIIIIPVEREREESSLELPPCHFPSPVRHRKSKTQTHRSPASRGRQAVSRELNQMDSRIKTKKTKKVRIFRWYL